MTKTHRWSEEDPRYPKGDPRRRKNEDDLLRQDVVRLRRQRQAKKIVDSEGWQAPPDDFRSLSELSADPPSPVTQIVEGVLPEGISIMAAQFKAGKTTLAINLAGALGSGEDFLGSYPVNFPSYGNIAYWNMEVDAAQFYEWSNRCIKDEEARDRIVICPNRGRHIDFLDDNWAAWTVDFLGEMGIKFWIIDPLGRMLNEENSNSEFNRWFRRLEEIVRASGVIGVFILHHTGHAGKDDANGIPRSRGASAIMGGSDANLAYRHGGDLGGYPPDNRRYLSGFGRGVDLPEITLDFDETTGRLYRLDNAPGRVADRNERLTDLAVEAFLLSGKDEMESRELQSAIGKSPAKACASMKAAVQAGMLVKTPRGRKQIYSLPEKEKVAEDA